MWLFTSLEWVNSKKQIKFRKKRSQNVSEFNSCVQIVENIILSYVVVFRIFAHQVLNLLICKNFECKPIGHVF